MATLSLIALTTALLAQGAVTPTGPGGDGQVFKAGENCTFSYDLDEDGTWKSFDVDLYSGSDLEMVNVTRVASGLDGTTGEGKYEFECPEVEPPAPIYFYQFTQDGKDAAWTSRFTIAATDGSTVDAYNATQPDGEPVPWGVGHLVNSTNTTAESLGNSLNPFSMNSSSKPLDNPLLPSSTSAGAGGWWTPETTTSAATAEQPVQTSPTGITGFMQGIACDSENLCPGEAPCCSEYGFCGTGRNCLAGCNPLASFQPGACAPVPACQTGDYDLTFWNKNRVLSNSSYWNGDASKYDWLVDKLGKPDLGALTANGTSGEGALTLSLTEDHNGTVITSTRSILYGNVTARIKSVAGAGVLTAFSLISGTKDEIDYEFTTNATDLAQTSYFYQGDLDDYSSGQEVNVTDRSAEFHNYTISWMPDAITWLVDGVAVRNVSKNDTTDFLSPGVYNYPQTPSRIQFSIWGAGREGNPDGLVEFAGGKVDWNESSYAEQGYYASYISGVSVECYDTSLLANWSMAGNTTMSGAFNSTAGLNASASVDPSLTMFQTDPLADAAPSATPTSATLWWTPPAAASASAKPSSEKADESVSVTTTSTTQTAWWTPAVKKLRRRLQLAKVKRAENAGSYTYGDIDEYGLPAVLGSVGGTVITNDAATGQDMTGGTSDKPPSDPNVDTAANPTTNTASAASHVASATSDASASPSSTSVAKTVQEKWDELSTGAHIGIYVGAAVLAVFLLVLIGWIWRKAASSRNSAHGTPGPDAGGAYFPINDQGEMLPAGQLYSGHGQIQPGQDLYSGGQVPAATAGAASVSRKSTSSSTNSKYQGGYIPSSQLKSQYGLNQEQAMKQV
ncbi:hypothetical protein JCM11641_001676 [Rhodosporidiobolus odoratus]